MPTYDYKCDACGHQFERFQSITSAPIRKCPSCGKNKVRRLIGPGAGLIFKGSGFYITDYRSEGYKDAAKKGEAGASGSPESKPDSSSASTDAKPAAAATESKPKVDTRAAAGKKRESKKK
jgi:putative FmdB family regulatory protein